jgi:hypothetical protein
VAAGAVLFSLVVVVVVLRLSMVAGGGGNMSGSCELSPCAVALLSLDALSLCGVGLVGGSVLVGMCECRRILKGVGRAC